MQHAHARAAAIVVQCTAIVIACGLAAAAPQAVDGQRSALIAPASVGDLAVSDPALTEEATIVWSFTSPAPGARYRTGDVIPIRFVVGYRATDPFYPNLYFAFTGGLSMQIGGDTGAFLYASGDYFYFLYGIDWTVPRGDYFDPSSGPVFGCNIGAFSRAGVRPSYVYRLIGSVENIIVTIDGIPSPDLPLPCDPGAGPCAQGGATQEFQTWGLVKSMFR